MILTVGKSSILTPTLMTQYPKSSIDAYLYLLKLIEINMFIILEEIINILVI